MAPERSARVVKRLVAQQQLQQHAQNARSNMLDEEQDQLKAIKATIAQEQEVLIKLRDEIELLKESRDAYLDNTDLDDDTTNSDEDPIAHEGIGPISVSKRKARKISDEREKRTKKSGEEEAVAQDRELEEEEEVVEEEDPYPEDCNLVLAPISAEAGLGIQTEHLWKHLTLAKTYNACIALPPVVAKTTAALRYVPFHEVIDLDSLIIDGAVRAVPLSACKKRGISAIYSDDADIENNIKMYPHYVRKADPVLAIESDNLKAGAVREFKPFDGDDNNLSEEAGSCIGMGRMRADIPTDEGVVSAWKLHPKIAHYVHNRYPNLREDTLFVKLRTVCDTQGDICLGNPEEQQVIHIQEYINAVKEEALRLGGIANIYISIPANTRQDTLEYLAHNIHTLDNVILNLEGDEFAANLVEREIATNAKGFVHDWGIWGDTITKIRKATIQNKEEEIAVSNADIMQRWTDAGRPDHSNVFAPPAPEVEETKKEYVPPQTEQLEEGNEDLQGEEENVNVPAITEKEEKEGDENQQREEENVVENEVSIEEGDGEKEKEQLEKEEDENVAESGDSDDAEDSEKRQQQEEELDDSEIQKVDDGDVVTEDTEGGESDDAEDSEKQQQQEEEMDDSEIQKVDDGDVVTEDTEGGESEDISEKHEEEEVYETEPTVQLEDSEKTLSEEETNAISDEEEVGEREGISESTKQVLEAQVEGLEQ